MRCPICGARLYQKQICQYCKITDDDIKNASNKKVKEERKFGNTDLIHYSSVIPKDVNKWKLWLYTIFLGFVGVNHFYVNRPVRAWFSVITTSLSMIILFITMFSTIQSQTVIEVILTIYDIVFLVMTVNVIMWISDIINLIFKIFKVPVVLPEKEDVEVKNK